MITLLLMALGVVLLYFGAEWLVLGSARVARGLGVSPIVVGLTVVSLGTSAPELVVASLAAMEGSGDLAVGNVLGSNLANVGLILGLAAVVRPLPLAGRVVRREVPIMLAVTFLLYPLVLDLEVGRTDGLILLGVLLSYLLFVGWTAAAEEPEILEEYEKYVEEEAAYVTTGDALRDVGMVVVGAAGVVLGGHLIVESALVLAQRAGISELVIGITVVAVGTSLPELATSTVAAVRDEADIAVGNIVGSNVFNLTAVLGTASVLRPVEVARSVLFVELPAVLAISVLILVIGLTGPVIRRWEGAVLLAAYGGAGLWVFL